MAVSAVTKSMPKVALYHQLDHETQSTKFKGVSQAIHSHLHIDDSNDSDSSETGNDYQYKKAKASNSGAGDAGAKSKKGTGPARKLSGDEPQ